MNASFASPHTSASVALACPWCDEVIAVDDAFSASAIRCGSCATSVDLEPLAGASSGTSLEIAA